MKEILITSSVLIAVLAALRFLFRRRLSRRLQYALWLLVLARLLLPVSLPQASFSVMNGVETLAARVETAQAAVPQPVSSAAVAPSAIHTAPAAAAVPSPAPAAPVLTISASELARILWLAGVAVTAACFLASNLRLVRRLRRTGKPLDADCPLPVYVSGAVVSPCLFGLFRPAIYVTPKAAASRERLRHVLTHELCHYRHGDHVWSVLRCLCLSVYWFDPLVWLAAVLSKADGELACDEAAIRALGAEQRLAYGRTLVDMIAVQRPAAGMLCAATTMVSGRRSLRARINRIARNPKALLSAALAALLIAAVVTGCTFTAATNDTASPPTDTLELVENPESRPFDSEGDCWQFRYDLDPERFQGACMWAEIWSNGNCSFSGGLTTDLSNPQRCIDIALEDPWEDGVRTLTLCQSADSAMAHAISRELPEAKSYPARVTSWLGGASDEQPYAVTPDQPIVLACVIYQPEDQAQITSYDCSYLSEFPEALAKYDLAVVFKAVFTSGDPEDYPLPADTGVELAANGPASASAEATYTASLIRDGQETPLQLDEDLMADVIFNSLVRSAAWPNEQPVDAYPYAIRIRETTDGSTRDYYACRKDGQAILMGPSMYTGLSEELMARLEIAAGLDTSLAYSLGDAISKTILRIYADPWVEDGQCAAEAHVMLGTKESGSEITAYVDALYLVYSEKNGRLDQDGVGGHMPMAFTFTRNDSGAYACTEAWHPKDGTYYAPSIREKFPAELAEDAIDSQRLALALTQECHRQAAAALSIDTTAEIERLLHTVCDGSYATVEDCIDAHSIDYREMTYYGDAALNYAVNYFLDGNRSGMEAEVLWRLLHALYPGEIELFESPAADAQTEFDQWCDYVNRIAAGNGEEYYQHNHTATTLLSCHRARNTPMTANDAPATDADPMLPQTHHVDRVHPITGEHHSESHH